jgi:hypothetical protein
MAGGHLMPRLLPVVLAVGLSIVLALVAHPALAQPRPRPGEAGELFVLAINGGGDKLDNFASHLGHLRQLIGLLATAGIANDHLTVLSSDGQDPAPDLATREPDPENAWLLQGTRLDPMLRDLTTYEDSRLPGVDLRPATVGSLEKALAELRTRLHPGDTLLIYVTDHGSQDRRDPLGNRISLWGARESISVRKLGALLARLPSSVRVVSLMSQCFSGGFAYLHETREHRRTPSGRTCGYFSSTSDRPAYGCYPEVRGQKGIGHSFEFLSALARRGRFSAAHADVLVSDGTPDIPLRSSDVYLAEQLARAAGAPSREPGFVAPLLRQAFADPALAPALGQIDRLAAAYGVQKPSSLQDLEDQADAVFDLLDDVEAQAKVWEGALGDFNQANLDAFLAARPAWRPRLEEPVLRALDSAALRALATALLSELDAFVRSDAARVAEADRLLTTLGDADELSYRNEIRAAALLRMRFVLTTAAGRVWLRDQKEQAKAFEALGRCEDLTLPIKDRGAPRAEPPAAGKFPSLVEDRRRAMGTRPGWLGLTFVPVGRGRRKRLALPEGAAQVTSVAPRSPAAAAGLQANDIIVGPPNRPFGHPNDLRPFIVTAGPGTPLPIEVLRGNARLVLRPTVGAARWGTGRKTVRAVP